MWSVQYECLGQQPPKLMQFDIGKRDETRQGFLNEL